MWNTVKIVESNIAAAAAAAAAAARNYELCLQYVFFHI
jgi:hypothetical protein